MLDPDMTQKTLRWKLFPFSIKEKAEQWYTHNVRSVNGDWEKLRVDFYHSLSSLSHIASLRSDILLFYQIEKESIGSAWARFSHLLASNRDWSIPDDISLHIFCIGLDMESVEDLDIAAEGSFAHKTPMEGNEIIDHILGNSSFLTYPCEPQQESKSSHERPSTPNPTLTFHIPRFVC
jgi:hypothetical protein